MRYLLAGMLVFLSGCASYTYNVSDGKISRSITIRKWFDRTDIGDIEMVTPDGVKVHIKGYSSDRTKSLDKLIDKIPNAAVVP